MGRDVLLRCLEHDKCELNHNQHQLTYYDDNLQT